MLLGAAHGAIQWERLDMVMRREAGGGGAKTDSSPSSSNGPLAEAEPFSFDKHEMRVLLPVRCA